ncbi:hypothetical protein [Nocardia speluncae]|nr:hypothetical protein [Nocardia speluncae]
MGPDFLTQLNAMRFDHPWLDEAFAEESRRQSTRVADFALVLLT